MVKKTTLLHEPKFDKQCTWRDRGEQCQSYGSLSTGIVGGPWYCRLHFAAVMGWPAWEAPAVDESLFAIDERVNRIVPRIPGESEHEWSMRCKDWVVRRLKKPMFHEPMREPGEDLEAA